MDKRELKRKAILEKERLLQLFYPLSCPVCGKKLPVGIVVCETCKEKLPFMKEPYCMKCGKQLESETAEYCFDCSRHPHFYKQGIAVFGYDACIRKAIYEFKYKNRRDKAAFFAKFMAEALEEKHEFWKTDILVPVPIHNKKKKERGYNQAEVLADAVAVQSGFVVKKDLLYRTRATLPQKELTNQQRYLNLKAAFAVDEKQCAGISRVILIDDIYTTGSTIDHCARMLRAAGVSEVYYAAIAIGAGI